MTKQIVLTDNVNTYKGKRVKSKLQHIEDLVEDELIRISRELINEATLLDLLKVENIKDNEISLFLDFDKYLYSMDFTVLELMFDITSISNINTIPYIPSMDNFIKKTGTITLKAKDTSYVVPLEHAIKNLVKDLQKRLDVLLKVTPFYYTIKCSESRIVFVYHETKKLDMDCSNLDELQKVEKRGVSFFCLIMAIITLILAFVYNLDIRYLIVFFLYMFLHYLYKSIEEDCEGE